MVTATESDDGRTDCQTTRIRIPTKIRIDFEGGTITGDAGLTLIREFDYGLGLTTDVASRITDGRDQRYVTHDMATLIRQAAASARTARIV